MRLTGKPGDGCRLDQLEEEGRRRRGGAAARACPLARARPRSPARSAPPNHLATILGLPPASLSFTPTQIPKRLSPTHTHTHRRETMAAPDRYGGANAPALIPLASSSSSSDGVAPPPPAPLRPKGILKNASSGAVQTVGTSSGSQLTQQQQQSASVAPTSEGAMLGGGGGSSDEPERGYGPSCLSSATSVTYTRTHTVSRGVASNRSLPASGPSLLVWGPVHLPALTDSFFPLASRPFLPCQLDVGRGEPRSDRSRKGFANVGWFCPAPLPFLPFPLPSCPTPLFRVSMCVS